MMHQEEAVKSETSIRSTVEEKTPTPPPSENGDTKGSVSPPPTSELIPVPPPVPRSGVPILAHKLWIGNLDKRLTEQNILQFVTKYGEVVSFRFHFKAGAERAEPRGYCFVEYSTREEAEKAKAVLDGKIALGKKIIVDWARQDQGAKKSGNSVSETWDASTVSETLDSGVSTSAKIAALEAKLKQMEEEELGISKKRPKLSTQEQLARVRRKTGAEAQIIHRPTKKHHRRTVQRSLL